MLSIYKEEKEIKYYFDGNEYKHIENIVRLAIGAINNHESIRYGGYELTDVVVLPLDKLIRVMWRYKGSISRSTKLYGFKEFLNIYKQLKVIDIPKLKIIEKETAYRFDANIYFNEDEHQLSTDVGYYLINIFENLDHKFIMKLNNDTIKHIDWNNEEKFRITTTHSSYILTDKMLIKNYCDNKFIIEPMPDAS